MFRCRYNCTNKHSRAGPESGGTHFPIPLRIEDTWGVFFLFRCLHNCTNKHTHPGPESADVAYRGSDPEQAPRLESLFLSLLAPTLTLPK